MISTLRFVLVLALFCVVTLAGSFAAESTSPIGLWQTPRGFVRVYETDGKFFGKIERSVTPGDETRICTACKDERKDQPIIGLVIMRNVRFIDGRYEDGDILDATSGSVYRCRFSLEEGGTVLIMRGFIGVALLGKSVSWQRAE